MPISTWDAYTVFIIVLSITASTFFIGLATKRIYRISLMDRNHEDIEYRLNYKEKVLLVLSFISVVLVVGLQMSNSDYFTYKSLYQYTYSQTYNLFQLEGIFRTINKIVYDYIHEFQYVVLATSCITNVFMFNNVIYYSLQSKINPKHCFFMYLSMYMLVSFGMLRQICAASIVIFSLRYLPRRQYIKYAIFTILASGFHATAIISILLLLFSAINIKIKNIRLLYRIVVIVAFYIVVIFSNQLLSLIGALIGRGSYSDYFAPESIGLGNIIYRIPVIIFMIVFRTVIKKSPVFVRMFTSLVMLEVLVCFSYYFIPMLGGRLQYYILFGYAIVIPYCIGTINKNRNVSSYQTSLIVYGFGFYYLFNLMLTTEWITKYLMPIQFFSS